MYKIQLNNITDTTDSIYKEVDRSHLKDIEIYFKSMKLSGFDRITYCEKYNLPDRRLNAIQYSVKLKKNINNNLVVIVFSTLSGKYAIVYYNITLIPGKPEKNICYVSHYNYVIMYLFLLESKLKLDTKNSKIMRYPSYFFKNYKQIKDNFKDMEL
jgi:hypothetical protein|tara:strand:+ start:87 stop:554 length:468 start_codon:yes stop_codon:yes gene_type:complete